MMESQMVLSAYLTAVSMKNGSSVALRNYENCDKRCNDFVMETIFNHIVLQCFHQMRKEIIFQNNEQGFTESMQNVSRSKKNVLKLYLFHNNLMQVLWKQTLYHCFFKTQRNALTSNRFTETGSSHFKKSKHFFQQERVNKYKQ